MSKEEENEISRRRRIYIRSESGKFTSLDPEWTRFTTSIFNFFQQIQL